MRISLQHSTTKHQTMASYVVGYLLSLIFTLAPYYLVVHHLVFGITLLLTILGFAVVQLIVQVVFFLHLGRGPKPKWNLYFFIATIGVILVVVGGSVIIIHNLHNNLATSDQTKRLVDSEGIYQVGGVRTGACQGRHANYRITIKNGKTDPLLAVASQCDTLTFINNDNVNLELTFGTHQNHSVYAGLTAFELRKEHTKTITLSELGTYQFHDHMRPEIKGSFAVVNNY